MTQYNKAPEVTRQRLYIDAQEQILSNTSKVLVDQKGGNSLLYLPLDKLMTVTGAQVPSSNTSQSSASAKSPVASPEQDPLRSREREGR